MVVIRKKKIKSQKTELAALRKKSTNQKAQLRALSKPAKRVTAPAAKPRKSRTTVRKTIGKQMHTHNLTGLKRATIGASSLTLTVPVITDAQLNAYPAFQKKETNDGVVNWEPVLDSSNILYAYAPSAMAGDYDSFCYKPVYDEVEGYKSGFSNDNRSVSNPACWEKLPVNVSVSAKCTAVRIAGASTLLSFCGNFTESKGYAYVYIGPELMAVNESSSLEGSSFTISDLITKVRTSPYTCYKGSVSKLLGDGHIFSPQEYDSLAANLYAPIVVNQPLADEPVALASAQATLGGWSHVYVFIEHVSTPGAVFRCYSKTHYEGKPNVSHETHATPTTRKSPPKNPPWISSEVLAGMKSYGFQALQAGMNWGGSQLQNYLMNRMVQAQAPGQLMIMG